MISTNYKKEAQSLYRNNELLEAYQCAWKLPFSNFLPWFIKKGIESNKNISFFNDSFFYNSFLITQSTEWLRHNAALLLWEHYLNAQEDISLQFELYVAHNNPSLFIEGYKNRLIFLNDKRIKQLEGQHLPLSIVNELKIWNRFNTLLNTKWNEVIEMIESLGLEPHELCMAICAAFEAFVYQNPDDKTQWHNASETLSLLLAFIQNKYNLSNLKVNEKALVKAYAESVFKLRAVNIFNKVYEYVLLRDNAYRYAYEPGLTVFVSSDGVLSFQESDIFNKQWEYDTYRYVVNEQSYYGFGEQLFKELKESNKIKYINGNKKANNQLGNVRQLIIKQAIYDLGILDEDLKNNKLPNLNFMISFIHGLAWRKTETTEKPLHKIARIKQNDYSQGVAELINKNKVSEFILISNNSILFNAAKTSGLNFTSQEFDQLINAFSFSWKSEMFNPLKLSLSLWQKPFIQLGKHVISPISILTGFTGLYTVSESILKNFRPREGKRIEKILKDTYDNTGWKTSLLENNQEYGDIDVVMEDDKNIVFMQLKRTTQKTNILELHNQRAQDRKAIKQLIEAKAGSKSHKKMHLWYVTTAFEKIGTWEREVYRVSYQDLIHVKRLLDSEGLRFNNLNDFIEMIESDTPYKIGKQSILN